MYFLALKRKINRSLNILSNSRGIIFAETFKNTFLLILQRLYFLFFFSIFFSWRHVTFYYAVESVVVLFEKFVSIL